MDDDRLKSLVQSYRHYEDAFVKQCTTDLADSLLYGEIAFCLARLKPAVLYDFPAGLNTAYIEAVVRPWMAQHDKDLADDWILIQRYLYSPEMRGNLVFFLVAIPTTMESLLLTAQRDDHARCDVVNEDQLATLLDYPGRLPRSMHELDTLREVVYYNKLDRHILTTFACQIDQQEVVRQHFLRYQDTMAAIDLPLGLILRRPV